MPLTPEQHWTLVSCGMIAHADDVVQAGEWRHVVQLVDEHLDEDEERTWLEILSDRAALEQRFAELEPLPEALCESVLRRCWHMALADGSGSVVEAEVHDRIAERLGLAPEHAAARREIWTREAERRSELVLGFAAIMANVDGRVDCAEAVQFDALLDRLPVSAPRRVDLCTQVVDPPEMDEVVAGLVALSHGDRVEALRDLAPLVAASARGRRERDAFLELAERIGVLRSVAEGLL
jgi:uncharacterized tellurite resistance protein B-like protein